MSLTLAPEIIGFLKSKTRKIKKGLSESKNAILIQNGMPPRVILGTHDSSHFESNTTGKIPFTVGESNEHGIVLPSSLSVELIKVIRKVFLPGGTPIENTTNALLGDDPSTSNAAIIILPVYANTPELEKISGILNGISGSLGISVILVETEPLNSDTTDIDVGNSTGSILAESYRFASEILKDRVRKDLRPIIILPSKKTLTSPIDSEMIKSLRKAIIEGVPQQNWIKLDAAKLTHQRVLQQLGLEGTRAKIIGASEPFLHSGVNTMVIRARVSGNISYPIIPKNTNVPLLNEKKIKTVLEKHSITPSQIQKFIRSMPRESVCFSDAYYLSSLSKVFTLIRSLRQTIEVSCEIAQELLEGTMLCKRTITLEDIPIPPPTGTKVINGTPKTGNLVWYGEEEYIVVWEDSVAGLVLLLPKNSTFTLDRVLAPYSYVYVMNNKKPSYKVMVPGIGTSEYLSVCKLKRNIKKDKRGKETVNIDLDNHICIMERSILLENSATPHWEGSQSYLSWDRSRKEWKITVQESGTKKEYTQVNKKSRWHEGWCGEYKNGDDSILISERHGSIYDGAKAYLQEQEIREKSNENIVFSGRPELSGEHREYTTMRLGMMSCLMKDKRTRVILHPLGAGGTEPQMAWVSHMIGMLNEPHGLRYICDDNGLQELFKSYKTLPMYRFHSLTETPVFKSKEENDFERAITNPESKMTQFITFVSDFSQLYNLGWKMWAKGGPPLYRPPNKASGIASVVQSAKEVIKRANIPMYSKITPESIAWGIKYVFHKLRAGVFVSIRSNSISTFLPMVKLEYKNTYPRDDSFWFGDGMNEKQYLAIKNKVLGEMKLHKEKFNYRNNWFANNSLIGNMRSESMNDGFIMVTYHMLQETLKHHAIGDCDFILNTRDFPKLRYDGRDPEHAVYGVLPGEETPQMNGYEMPMIDGERRCVPFLGFNTQKHYADIPIVDPDTWLSSYGGYFGTREHGSEEPIVPNEWAVTKEAWGKRSPTAVFRGSATGYGSGSDDNQRLFIGELFPHGDPHVDFAITSGAVRDRKTDSRGMRYIVPEHIAEKVPGAIATTSVRIQKSKRLPVNTSQEEYDRTNSFVGQDMNRMILYIDGNAGAYRYTSLMRAGFCILKLDSLIGYEMWMYPSLKEALPGSNTEDFLTYTNEQITALFDKDGDHITIDKEGRSLRKVIEWANSSETTIEMARIVANNAINKYKRMCNKKTLMSLTSLTLNVLSQSQEWTVSHSPSKKDISEPFVSRDIIRTLDRVKQSEREQEAILRAMQEDTEEEDYEEMLQKFVRPTISTSVSERDEEKLNVSGQIEKIEDDLEPVVVKEEREGVREYTHMPKLRTRRTHGAIGFLKSELGSDAGGIDVAELI
jgi:hypothetical protein